MTAVLAASKPLVFTVTALPSVGALYSATGLISQVVVVFDFSNFVSRLVVCF